MIQVGDLFVVDKKYIGVVVSKTFRQTGSFYINKYSFNVNIRFINHFAHHRASFAFRRVFRTQKNNIIVINEGELLSQIPTNKDIEYFPSSQNEI